MRVWPVILATVLFLFVGSICLSQWANFSSPFLRTARNLNDSGSASAIAIPMISGTTPPKMNTDRQPKAGISQLAT